MHDTSNEDAALLEMEGVRLEDSATGDEHENNISSDDSEDELLMDAGLFTRNKSFSLLSSLLDWTKAVSRAPAAPDNTSLFGALKLSYTSSTSSSNKDNQLRYTDPQVDERKRDVSRVEPLIEPDHLNITDVEYGLDVAACLPDVDQHPSEFSQIFERLVDSKAGGTSATERSGGGGGGKCLSVAIGSWMLLCFTLSNRPRYRNSAACCYTDSMQ